jgi:hypothetical protein
MPQRLDERIGGSVQRLRKLVSVQKKMASMIEAIRQKSYFESGLEAKATVAGVLDSQGSEPDAGKVAVAVGDLGALHQQPVDRRHQAAEQGVGMRE